MLKRILKYANKKYLESIIKKNHNNNVNSVCNSNLINSITDIINQLSLGGFGNFILYISIPETFDKSDIEKTNYGENAYNINVKNRAIAFTLYDMLRDYYEPAYSVNGIGFDARGCCCYCVKISWKQLIE